MIVCVCRRVSDRDIVRAVQEGAGSFEELQLDTGAATQCGRCGDCAREVFMQACQSSLAGLCAAVAQARGNRHAVA